MSKQARTAHRWKFTRSGGVDQVVIRSGADIMNLFSLDLKLWVALSCPTRGLEFDSRTLDLIDLDRDGRIRAPELLASIAWLGEILRDPEVLIPGRESLELAAIDEGTHQGAMILACARRILANLGKAGSATISLPDVLSTEKVFSATNFNGDGVVPADVAPDPSSKGLILDILSTHGAVLDRSGKSGVDRDKVDAFYSEVEALDSWARRGDAESVRDLPAATDAVLAIRTKVDDFFLRCRLAAVDDRAAETLSASEDELRELGSKNISLDTPALTRLPLARIGAGNELPLKGSVNPAWQAALDTLLSDAVTPILGAGKTSVSGSEWNTIVSRVSSRIEWLCSKPATRVEALGLARVGEIATGNGKQQLMGLILQDESVKPEMEQLDATEKLLRLVRDLTRLLNNFVNFSAFYSRKGATFQVGTLYLDGRSCDLCVLVDDAARHGSLATLARTFLAYCECVRQSTGEKMTIAAAFTDGDSDHLLVGRNGIFYDRSGRDWDATITRVVEAPISIRQAFWAPYKSFVRAIEDQLARRAAAAEADVDTQFKSTVEASVADPKKGPAEVKKMDVGTVAAIGVALGSIGGIVSTLLTKFIDLGAWVPFGVLGLMLAISGPSMLIAWLKLRQRNLGPILDANGWAINGRVKVNIPFGGALTTLAIVPPGSERSLVDPYAEKRKPWRLYTALALSLLASGSWCLGTLDTWLPAPVRSSTVLPAMMAWMQQPREELAPSPAPASPEPPSPSASPAG